MRALAEGLSTRLAAERGLDEGARAAIEHALATGDKILVGKCDPHVQRAIYSEANEIFHATIHHAARSSLVEHVVRLSQRVPQASSRNIIAFQIEDVRRRHRAHHEIYEAILAREPLRAERLMREHILAMKLLFVQEYCRRATSEGNRDSDRKKTGVMRRTRS